MSECHCKSVLAPSSPPCDAARFHVLSMVPPADDTHALRQRMPLSVPSPPIAGGPEARVAEARDRVCTGMHRSVCMCHFPHADCVCAYSFRPGRQEDAHEYLRCLLDHLHEGHLRGQYGSGPPQPPLEFTTFVHRIFGGLARSQLRCVGVDYESSQYEPFLDLSLEIFRCGTDYHISLTHKKHALHMPPLNPCALHLLPAVLPPLASWVRAASLCSTVFGVAPDLAGSEWRDCSAEDTHF